MGYIGEKLSSEREATERHIRVHGHTIPEYLLAAEVTDATRNWWNATNFTAPRSARRWARLWDNHALRDRECPLPKPVDEDGGDGGDSDGTVSSETESDYNDDTGDSRGQEMPTVRAWRKQLCIFGKNRDS